MGKGLGDLRTRQLREIHTSVGVVGPPTTFRTYHFYFIRLPGSGDQTAYAPTKEIKPDGRERGRYGVTVSCLPPASGQVQMPRRAEKCCKRCGKEGLYETPWTANLPKWVQWERNPKQLQLCWVRSLCP